MKKYLSLFLTACFISGCLYIPTIASNEVDLFPISRVYLSSYYSTSAVKPGNEKSMSDGNTSTYWATKEGGNSFGRMIVDLGKPIEISQIQFVTNSLNNCCKDFSIYLTNDGECADMKCVYSIDANTVLTYKKEYSIYPETKECYRYVVAQTNQKKLQLGFSEFRILAECDEIQDNSIFNVSGQGCGFVSSGTLSTPVISVANQMPNITWTSSPSNYNKGDYVYIDLGAPQKIDSVSISFNTSSSVNSKVTDKEMLRTDFQIVGRNDLSSTDAGDTILIDHKETLAKGVGDCTNICALQIPQEYQDKEFRYVGIKKKPTENNKYISQMCIASFDVYSKARDCQEAFGTLKSSYNSSENSIYVNFAARTAYDKEYQLVAAYYDKADKLVCVDTNRYLKRASDTVASEIGQEIMATNCPAAIQKKFDVPNNDEILYAKIYIMDSFGNIRPLVKNIKTTVNYSSNDDVQLVYSNVKEYLDLPLDAAIVAEHRVSDREITIEWEPIEGATSYTLVTSTSSNYSAPNTYANLADPRCNVTNLLCGGATCYWKVTSDNGKTITGKFKPDSSVQKPFEIKWEEVAGANSYTVYFSSNSDYSNAKIYYTDVNSVFVTNLDLGTRYYWRAMSDNGTEKTGTFKTTSNAPRFITTHGTTNVRDLGGWETSSGKRVNTGKIFRGAELNPSANVTTTEYKITDADREFFVNELGIKTEIDLRSSAARGDTSKSPLGDDVAYYACELGSGYGEEMQNSYYTSSYKKVFQVLGDENNYPIYFHCYGGADRTGTIAWLVNGLLGVDIKDLYHDYELTSFSNSGLRARQGEYGDKVNSIIEYLAEFPGDTMSEQIENYLKSIGITDKEIKTIKAMMLE